MNKSNLPPNNQHKIPQVQIKQEDINETVNNLHIPTIRIIQNNRKNLIIINKIQAYTGKRKTLVTRADPRQKDV